MDKIFDLLEDLMEEKFYGSVEIKFEAGRPVIIRKSQTLKPEDLR